MGGGIAINPFRLLADVLTWEGVAVLRFDDHDVGESTGTFSTAVASNFASDAKAAIDCLLTREKIASDHIGVFAHSAGGLVAAMLCARNDDLEDHAHLVTEQAKSGFGADWFASFVAYDPAPEWVQTTVPVLAVFGGKDGQVDAEQNASPSKALAGVGPLTPAELAARAVMNRLVVDSAPIMPNDPAQR